MRLMEPGRLFADLFHRRNIAADIARWRGRTKQHKNFLRAAVRIPYCEWPDKTQTYPKVYWPVQTSSAMPFAPHTLVCIVQAVILTGSVALNWRSAWLWVSLIPSTVALFCLLVILWSDLFENRSYYAQRLSK